MSTNRRIYLDFNATAPLIPAARDAMVEAMADVGNPSSIHEEGRRLRDRIERARNQVATLVGRPREQIVFTSGGTEANWRGIFGLAAEAEARKLPKVIATTKLEHPSVRGPIETLATQGWEVVGLDGAADAGLVVLALVNHELGTIHRPPKTRGLTHVDAVQAAGKLSLSGILAESIAISAHKIGGPQGVGALVTSVDTVNTQASNAGHQERGRRGGTENTLGIIGFGAAASTVDLAMWPHVAALGVILEAGLVALGARIHGIDYERVGGTSNAAFAGAGGHAIVMSLDLEGIAVATGAACSSGSVKPSEVLLGLGLTPEQAREAVRFSLGRTTTRDEIEKVLSTLPSVVERARLHR